MDVHYNATLYHHLSHFFEHEDWDGIIHYLDSLSHSQFRTAGYLLGERLLQAVGTDTFWNVAERLILWQPKAFTVTMAKAATTRLKEGSLSLDDAGFLHLCEALRSDGRQLDREKLLLQWLPVATLPATIEKLFERLNVVSAHRRTDFLLRTEGLAAGFVLLRTLRFEEHNRAFLLTTCRQLIKRGNSLSFNLASLLRTYFDLQEIRGVFSLTLQPYELSRLDTDFDVFRRIVTKV